MHQLVTILRPVHKICVKRIDCTVCLERRWHARGFSKCLFEYLSINKVHVVGLGGRKCRGSCIYISQSITLIGLSFSPIFSSFFGFIGNVLSACKLRQSIIFLQLNRGYIFTKYIHMHNTIHTLFNFFYLLSNTKNDNNINIYLLAGHSNMPYSTKITNISEDLH